MKLQEQVHQMAHDFTPGSSDASWREVLGFPEGSMPSIDDCKRAHANRCASGLHRVSLLYLALDAARLELAGAK